MPSVAQNFSLVKSIFILYVDQSAQAAVTKLHRLDGLNNRNLLLHISGGWKSKVKVPSGLVLVGPPSLACRRYPSHCVLTWPSFVSAHSETEGGRDLASLLTRTPVLSEQGPNFMISSNLDYLSKFPVSKHSDIGN